MVVIKNCQNCMSCTRLLPEVFQDNKQGGIHIDEENADEYSREQIEAICPYNNISVEVE